ncbi:MAG: putative 2-aminoethylphosphonate ABC transporter permease subunit [Candidatus Rokuibacteriota bacterium]|nr:MAG: putative 2-aminoethylphosphonate ABC transporter permease subunit [Candidatus Rokubacteria bacterium]
MADAATARAGDLAAPLVRPQLSRDEWGRRALIGIIALYLLIALALPLGLMLAKSVEGPKGEWVGAANYLRYFSTPALFQSIGNSLWVAILSTVITVPLAFVYAYALTRSCMPARGLFKTIALIPILVPSLLPGLALVYLFGNQGLIKGLLFGHKIYGPIGIVMAEAFTTFPHALLIIVAALSLADARLYEAAVALRATRRRIFTSVTLPGARYGLISATFVVFTTVITDFGAPKVIGGQYNVLATDVYKQVIGQQNFQMGAVVSTILLLPAALAFFVDRMARRRQVALLSIRAVPYQPRPHRAFDRGMLAYCVVIGVLLLGMMAVSQYAALVKFFPYNLSFTLAHYDFDQKGGGGWSSYYNSIRLSLLTAVVGTVVVFVGAYLVEKGRGFLAGRAVFQFLAMLPMAVPGLVLGLAYIFFFNHPANPLNSLYRTMAILVISTVVHFYTVGHLTAVTALRQMDPEFETVAASLRQPFYKTFWRVTVPVCLPAILDIGIYLFVNAMTTVSAVVFLYGPKTELASVSVLNMDDTGEIASAAAMAMMIFYTNVGARALHAALARWLERRTQAWRRGTV